jgi:hypothetical protein
MVDRELSSAGHKLGQLVGDWFEEHFVLPLLLKVADHLKLFLDHRFRTRKCRESQKIVWADEEGNRVDYDFVMELDGTDDKKGIPVAFQVSSVFDFSSGPSIGYSIERKAHTSLAQAMRCRAPSRLLNQRVEGECSRPNVMSVGSITCGIVAARLLS